MSSLHASPEEPEWLPTRPSLLARLRNHADSASWHRGWEEFYAIYCPVVFRYARKRGLSETDAEDLVQEVVAGLARRLPGFTYDPGRGSFKTWLFRICRNKVVDHLRRQGRGMQWIQPGDMADGLSVAEMEDTTILQPDEAWELAWELDLRRSALDLVGQRVKPMTMRLYLYHVVDGHDAATTVADFADPKVTLDAVHLARHRVQKMMDDTLDRLRSGAAATR